MKRAMALLAALPAMAQQPGTWTTYGQNYSGWRYSDLSSINTSNVKSLTPKWIFQTGVPGNMETTPLVFDGLMYMTANSNNAFALDLRTGKPFWHYSHTPPAQGLDLCCGQVNRGFAVIGNRVFKTNIDDHLVALDRRSGTMLWDVELGDYRKGYSGTVAPLAVKNLVVVGTAGAEFGIRGFIDAYDADSGKRVWRFYTIPLATEPGGDTWGPASAKRVGGSTWITGTYDPDLNLIYWGTGNPGPDMNGDDRPGDNLYTCSIVAIDADTGKLKWHYQFTPHDVHDWDAVADPVLTDLTIAGRKVKALIQANRNGHFYALDRTHGKLLIAKPYTKISWTTGIGADGRPVLVPGQDPTEEGNRACPGLGGGHNWQATAYSPQTNLFYFGSTDGCQLFYKSKHDLVEGQWFQLSTVDNIHSEPSTGSLVAVDPSTGETKWRYEMVSTPSSGLLTTAGGLVFVGDPYGYLIAVDARSGKPLWRFQTGAPIVAPPISYLLDGKQYIAVAAGTAMITFGL